MFNLEQLVYSNTEHKAVFQDSERNVLEIDFSKAIDAIISTGIIHGLNDKPLDVHSFIGDIDTIPMLAEGVILTLPNIHSSIYKLMQSSLKFPTLDAKLNDKEVKVNIGNSIKIVATKEEVQFEEFIVVLASLYSFMIVRSNMDYYNLDGFESLKIHYDTNAIWGSKDKVAKNIYAVLAGKSTRNDALLSGEFAQIELTIKENEEIFPFVFDDSCVEMRPLLTVLDHLMANQLYGEPGFKLVYPITLQIKHQNIPVSTYDLIIQEGGQCNLLGKEVTIGQAFKLLHTVHMTMAVIISGAIAIMGPKLMKEVGM